MPGVTKEQIKAAKKMTAIEFLRRYRPEELVKGECRNEYQLREHDSFKINGETSLWHWKSRDVGGRSALDYLIYVEGMKFVDAVLSLWEKPRILPRFFPAKAGKGIRSASGSRKQEKSFAYLIRRGISREVIEACVRAGILYESAGYRNAVFVGRDEQGTARYAFLRGTYSNSKKPFKAEVTEQRQTVLLLPPTGEFQENGGVRIRYRSHSPPDSGGTADKHRLSLGGIYAPREEARARPSKNRWLWNRSAKWHPESKRLKSA